MIELVEVSKRFGDEVAVDRISLRVERGELCALVGTSGCGKSTTLRMINRLIEHSAGDIRVDGQPVETLNEEALRRGIGYVIQSTGLFPHWTVARNIALVPRLLQWPRSQVEARVEELMELLGLPVDSFAGKYPDQLSGGQAQRVGVARALAADPEILLMDEPFGALDPITRDTLQTQLSELQSRLHKTIVFVTHDMDEALRLADRLVVMDAGRVVQQGTPLEVLRDPATPFVESMLGGEERGLKESALIPVAALMEAPGALLPTRVSRGASARQALSIMLQQHCERLSVVDEQERLVGELSLQRLIRAAPRG